jgi:Lon protease-like protein
MALGGYNRASDLPQVIPVFPLGGALLLPRGILPLNIFEPRYLNMIDDAMASERIIGMIQTRDGGPRETPALASMGCAGKITSFTETADGRYLISLTGLCRFKVAQELNLSSPYRQVRADYAACEDDLADPAEPEVGARDEVFSALKLYLEHGGLALDWGAAADAPLDSLIVSLSMALPFDAVEKQALLEAPDLVARRKTLIALLQIDAASDPDGAPPVMQ